MDISSSRRANSGPNARKDISKQFPKLHGDNLSRLNDETSTTHMEGTGEQKTDTLKTPTQTKIPLKRGIASHLPSKTAATQRTFARNQPKTPVHSQSKVSLQSKDVPNKKVETKGSKSSFNTFSTTSSCKTILPVKKSLPAKGNCRISRRSASTISYRSLSSTKNEDCQSIATMPKVTSSSGDHEMHRTARERVAENNKLKVFECMQKKLQEVQSDFMQKFETLKLSCPDKINVNFKFVSMVKNDDCKILVNDDDLLRLPKKLPAESVNDLKEKIRRAMESCILILLDNLRKAQEAETEFERTLNLEETHDKLQMEQSVRLNELNETINILCSMKNVELDSQILRMQNEIQEAKKSYQTMEIKMLDLRAAHVEEFKNMERALKEKYEAEISKKETQITEANKKHKDLEKLYEKLNSSIQQTVKGAETDQSERLKLYEELMTIKDNLHSMTKKCAHAEHNLKEERKDKSERIETVNKLTGELEAAKKKIEELRSHGKTEVTHQLKDKQKQIINLQNTIETLNQEKKALQEKVSDFNLNFNAIYDLRNKLEEAENRINSMQSNVEASARSALTTDIQNEIERLRRSELEKQCQIEDIIAQLSKAHFNVAQLEEQVQRDQQLLEVRSELITSLQTNDNSQRSHLEDMFAQVGAKNNTINELNNELRTKSEEFRNLFTTLSTKQMELARQEHMIKLLEESNERSQMLRVKQEEKIGRMEEEITQLKQTIGIYQNNVLGTAGCKNLLFAPANPGDEYNENFYYYTREKRRKRQMDITVKKYEN